MIEFLNSFVSDGFWAFIGKFIVIIFAGAYILEFLKVFITQIFETIRTKKGGKSVEDTGVKLKRTNKTAAKKVSTRSVNNSDEC